MPPTPQITKASIHNTRTDERFEVHFNPENLQYTITNTVRNTGSGNANKQYTGESTGKLSLDLLFDTTSSGEDVRLHTVRVARLMEPGSSANRTPPVVEFDWGLYTFAGMVENYRENIEFFSADGVPLRATVNLTLSSQDRVFQGGSSERRAQTGGSLLGGSRAGAIEAPPLDADDGRGVTQIATMAGNPEAGRDIAADNGIENMRFPGSTPIELNPGTPTTGGSTMTGSGSGNSSSSGSGSGSGSGSSGGNSAQPFAALRQAPPPTSGGLDLSNFSRPTTTAGLGTEDPSAFAIGGQASLRGSSRMKADVGTGGALKERIAFDGAE